MQLVIPNPVRLANAARQQNIKPTTGLLLVGAGVAAYFLFFRKPKAAEQQMSGEEGGYRWTITPNPGRQGLMSYDWEVFAPQERFPTSSGNAESYQQARDLVSFEISQLQAGA